MVNLELSRIMREIADQHVELSPDDDVLILTDNDKYELAKALTIAARGTGATASIQIIPKRDAHGAPPPESAAMSLRGADIVFVLLTYDITHTDAYRNAMESGTKIASMRGVTEDMFLKGGINTDLERMHEITVAAKDRLHAAETVRVTNPSGTDVQLDVEDRPAFVLDVIQHDLNDDIGSFPSGESPVSPTEGTTNGTIVFDHAIDNIGKLETPVELTVQNGEIVDVKGGAEARELQRTIDEADENATNIAEFALGTNPDARLAGNVMESKRKFGTVHFGIGDNKTLGGSVRSSIHLDGVILEPTVEIDGEVVVEQGTVLLDGITT